LQGRAMQHLHFQGSPSTRSLAEARKAWGLPHCWCKNSICYDTHSKSESPGSHPRTTRDCPVMHSEPCKQLWSMALETVPDCQPGPLWSRKVCLEYRKVRLTLSSKSVYLSVVMNMRMEIPSTHQQQWATRLNQVEHPQQGPLGSPVLSSMLMSRAKRYSW
jgi:hypothetical protein